MSKEQKWKLLFASLRLAMSLYPNAAFNNAVLKIFEAIKKYFKYVM